MREMIRNARFLLSRVKCTRFCEKGASCRICYEQRQLPSHFDTSLKFRRDGKRCRIRMHSMATTLSHPILLLSFPSSQCSPIAAFLTPPTHSIIKPLSLGRLGAIGIVQSLMTFGALPGFTGCVRGNRGTLQLPYIVLEAHKCAGQPKYAY